MISKNWMTTVAGIVSAAGSFVLFGQQMNMMFPHWLVVLALFMNVGGLAAFGVVAKQFNMTGGSIGQPSTPEALIVANQAPSAVNPPTPKE